MTEYLVTDARDNSERWIAAASAAAAVIAAEADRQGRPTKAFKASHYSEGAVVDESCGMFACRGLRCNVER